MSEKKIVINSGLSFTTILFITFLVLKLTNVITWSWWWVTAPLWVGPAIVLGLIILACILFVLAVMFGKF